LLRIILIIFAVCFLAFKVKAQVIAPSLGSYGRVDSYCGKEEITKDISKIPWIGCFYLSEGRSAAGEFLGHHVEVKVNINGEEDFTVDGTPVSVVHDKNISKSGTNLPFVHISGTAGYWICEGTDPGCPSKIEVFWRTPDKSILFEVVECLPPNYKECVSTQPNWDYLVSRRR
jgi:hypothetical protein